MEEEILIKKYDNRRLYCVKEARYVSLTEIRDYLQHGKKVRVVEKSSGKDITKYIMMQVLLEDRYDLLPTWFYQMILQSPRENVENYFRQFFPWMMEAFEKNKTGRFVPPGMKNPWMKNPFQMMNPFFPSTTEKKSKSSSSDKDNSQTTESKKNDGSEETMSEILKRLKELEDKLGQDK